jgi:hypothetical protein
MVLAVSGKQDVSPARLIPESRIGAFKAGKQQSARNSNPGDVIPQKEKAGTIVPALPRANLWPFEET